MWQHWPLFLPLWLWELNETWPVQPVAAFARANPGGEIRLKDYDERPSLNWWNSASARWPRSLSQRQPQKDCITEGQRGDGPRPTVGT